MHLSSQNVNSQRFEGSQPFLVGGLFCCSGLNDRLISFQRLGKETIGSVGKLTKTVSKKQISVSKLCKTVSNLGQTVSNSNITVSKKIGLLRNQLFSFFSHHLRRMMLPSFAKDVGKGEPNSK